MMRPGPQWVFGAVVVLLLSVIGLAQQPAKAAHSAATPEIARLAEAFAGDWNTTEQMERSDEFPQGSRHGVSHVRLGAGGSVLVFEGESNGSAGPLYYLITVWWDSKANVYRFFTCFRDIGSSCKVRGTAHWEGKNFVNEYEETVKGKATKLQDVWDQITPSSHRLVMSIDAGNGNMKPLVTSTSKRH